MDDKAYEKWLSQFKIIGDQAYSHEELPPIRKRIKKVKK